MKIYQDKNGDGFIEFEDHEKKIIKEKGRLNFTAEGIRGFANSLMELSVRIWSQTEEKPEFKHSKK